MGIVRRKPSFLLADVYLLLGFGDKRGGLVEIGEIGENVDGETMKLSY